MVHGLIKAGYDVTALFRTDLDITDASRIDRVIQQVNPDIVFNCTAYNAVDAAETDIEAAFAVNGEGPRRLAGAAARVGAAIVHYSTDFVFDGRAIVPYLEDAPPNPLNVYGASKLVGERAVRCHTRHYILRVESLFGGARRGAQRATVDYLADNIEAAVPVRAIVDRTVSLSYVDDVVRATHALLERDAPYGTYHCVTSGFTTWYEVARVIASHLGAGTPIIPVRFRDSPGVAERPRFCALSNRKITAAGVEMPSWKTALAQHLARRQRASASAPQAHSQIA